MNWKGVTSSSELPSPFISSTRSGVSPRTHGTAVQEDAKPVSQFKISDPADLMYDSVSDI